MNNLINIINKLQEILANSNMKTKIQLPQIVVVGAQSSGKTSILESIVGKDFLPRGNGIVTRRPLILQLKNVNSSKDWCEFLHTGKERFEDYSKVLEEIERETIRVAGTNKGISSDPIILKIYSRDVVDLTLVDLPGLVKVPIGEQPDNIDLLVRDLVFEYISNPNAIILAVTPGNSDLANSDSLKMAKEVDPNYQRTIGVITKLDLMDIGTDAIEILQNKTFPLKHGYVGVICRSQKESGKCSIEEALKREQSFFDEHPGYKSVRSQLGIKNLSFTLASILSDHIRKNLPNIKENISNEIFDKEKELTQLGQDYGFDKTEILNSYVLMLVFKFTNAYKEMIEGNVLRECSKFYIGGARINYIFQEIFRKEINSLDPYDTLSNDDIRTAIKNTNGLKPALFIPESAFEVLIKQQISRFSTPSLLCVKRVYDELKNIVLQIDLPELARFKKLETRIKQIMENVLDRCLEPTNQMISNLIDIEQAYINTSHPDFLGPEQSFMNIFDDSNILNLERNPMEVNSSSSTNTNSSAGGNHPSMNNQTGMRPLKREEDKIDYDVHKGVSNNNTNILVNSHVSPNYPNQMRPGLPSSREVMETCIIKNLITSYYHVVKKNINDLVPKTIMCFLVNQSKMMAEKEMVSQLYKSNELEVLLQEDPTVGKKRRNLKESVSFLKSSLDVLTSFNDLMLD